MDRRAFIGTLAGGLLAAPLAVKAQQAGKVWRIGWLTPAVMEVPSRSQREALRALGYVEGQAVAFESRSAEDQDVKRLELLLQTVPKARKVAVLDLQAAGFTLTEVQKVAEARGVQLHVTAVGNGREGYQRAFDGLAKARVEALLVPSFPRYFRDARQIIELAAKRRIPAVYEWPSMAEAGGLMAYGPTFAELDGRVAAFIDRILKGAKPADMPVIQPTKFALVINLKTARALGLTIPPSLLQRADQVIE